MSDRKAHLSVGPVEKALEQGGRCIVFIGSCPFDLGSQPVDKHTRDVMKFFQGKFDDFLSGVIGDRLWHEGVDSTGDSLNTFRRNLRSSSPCCA